MFQAFSKLWNTNPASPRREEGVGGFKHATGYIYDEFLPELRGKRGRKKYREMMDSDPIIGAMLYGITSIIRAAKWEFEPCEQDTEGKYSAWMKDTIDTIQDMTWDDVIEDALSMLGYGFAIQEIVIGKKLDGTIGLKKLAPRSQETIDRWDIDKQGIVKGLWQEDPNGYKQVYLQSEKYIHYKTTYARGNPEGRSMIRNAYKPYYFINNLQIQEAVGAERDLAGLPIIYAPSTYLDDATKRAELERIVRDIKFNDQGGLVFPSDVYVDGTGKTTNTRQFELVLASSDGTKSIDTDKIIARHRKEQAATLLADFILLGGDKGSYALSRDKTDLFIRAVEGILENLGQTIDKQITTFLWRMNGFPPEMMPKARPGKVAPIDLQVLGDFVSKVAGTGIMLNDEPTEEFIRESAGLPPAPKDRPLSTMDDEDDFDDDLEDETPEELDDIDEIEEGTNKGN